MGVPKKLYRYRNNDTEHFWDDLENAIVHRKFYLGKASEQNDPFEANPTISEPNIDRVEEQLRNRFGNNPIFDKAMVEAKEGRKVSRQEFRRKFRNWAPSKETAREYIASVHNMLKGLPARTGLASFSEASDCPLMWGLYANSHKGVALCFEQRFSEHQHEDLLPLEVIYQETRPVLSADEYAGLKDDDAVAAEKMAQKTFTTKASAWRHEKEWRLFDVSGKKQSYVSASSLKPIGLIFGCNTAPKLIDEAVQRFAEHIKFFQCELSESSFEIGHREIEV